MDNMLHRQIVIKALGTRIGIEDPLYTKYAITGFQSIVLMLKSVNVTIHRTGTLKRCQGSSHCIMMIITKT
jgi:hypothetical protein